jgi:hypothetical protein
MVIEISGEPTAVDARVFADIVIGSYDPDDLPRSSSVVVDGTALETWAKPLYGPAAEIDIEEKS